MRDAHSNNAISQQVLRSLQLLKFGKSSLNMINNFLNEKIKLINMKMVTGSSDNKFSKHRELNFLCNKLGEKKVYLKNLNL